MSLRHAAGLAEDTSVRMHARWVHAAVRSCLGAPENKHTCQGEVLKTEASLIDELAVNHQAVGGAPSKQGVKPGWEPRRILHGSRACLAARLPSCRLRGPDSVGLLQQSGKGGADEGPLAPLF